MTLKMMRRAVGSSRATNRRSSPLGTARRLMLVGLALCVQGGSVNTGAVPLSFANALDIVIGSH